jgi:hypothetical protein
MNFVSQAQKKWNYRCVDKTFFCEQLRKSYNLMRLFIRNYSKSNYWYLQERINANNVWGVSLTGDVRIFKSQDFTKINFCNDIYLKTMLNIIYLCNKFKRI